MLGERVVQIGRQGPHAHNRGKRNQGDQQQVFHHTLTRFILVQRRSSSDFKTKFFIVFSYCFLDVSHCLG